MVKKRSLMIYMYYVIMITTLFIVVGCTFINIRLANSMLQVMNPNEVLKGVNTYLHMFKSCVLPLLSVEAVLYIYSLITLVKHGIKTQRKILPTVVVLTFFVVVAIMNVGVTFIKLMAVA